MWNRFKWSAGVALVATLLVVSWFHFRTPPKTMSSQPGETVSFENSQTRPSGHDDIDDNPASHVGATTSKVEATTIKATSNDSFVESLSECFPELAAQAKTPEVLVEKWKSNFPQAQEAIDSIHYFFKNAAGEEFRAQILYTYSNSRRPVREFKLYKVLADGLPDPIKVSKNDRYNPGNTTLSKYIEFDSVFETQKKWSMNPSDKISIEVEELNSKIAEFQLIQNGKALRCHVGDCECKK